MMKNYFRIGLLVLAVSLYSCGGDDNSADSQKEETTAQKPNPNDAPANDEADVPEEEATPKSKIGQSTIDMDNKGIGPVTSIEIADEIDQDMADRGKELYDRNCTACHKPHEDMIGPAQAGLLERRSPEWAMNMILDPAGMLAEDPIAQEVQELYDGQIMTSSNLEEDEARAILEYIRTF